MSSIPMEVEEEIDDSLYSRQRYVLGDAAMKKMANSNVLIVGLGGLAVEIAKNVILAGVKVCTILDNKKCSMMDLGTQYFISEQDVIDGKTRLEASLSKLRELNPNVHVEGISSELTGDNNCLQTLDSYTCVVCTDLNLSVQLKVDEYCRNFEPPIPFISGQVAGLFSYGFCDFSSGFTVYDSNGEEARENFICNITNDSPGVVTVYDSRPHGMQDGDTIQFKEVVGMEELNGQEMKIKVLSPYQFSVDDLTGFSKYDSGGIAAEIKKPVTVNHENLEQQMKSPALSMTDYSKMHVPALLHLLFHVLSSLQARRKDFTLEEFKSQIQSVNSSRECPAELDTDVIDLFYKTRNGCFAPLCAVLGGFLAQEVIKALSGKFSPLNQWIHLDAVEVIDKNLSEPQPKNDRYDALRLCVGEDMCKKLSEVKLFMIGCGAIGCEMMKLYALLGIGSKGLLTITDNDLIEKSNLNRQFLFRPKHVQKSKSLTAAESAIEMNPELKIVAQELKVTSETEHTHHTDEFFKQQTIIVNALDNVEARVYIDQRCVVTERPLLESGTTGAKGHTQVIIPHLTESYGSQTDPVDEDVPFCSLKSFPATLDHCIIWARNKFNSSFVLKPETFNKFLTGDSTVQQKIENWKSGRTIRQEDWTTGRFLKQKPITWSECVSLARLKFEKYFNHKAQSLIAAYPLDHKRDDGNLFWTLPRRPPTPQIFSSQNSVHMDFVRGCARLYAEICQIKYCNEDLSHHVLMSSIENTPIPRFCRDTRKVIVAEAEDQRVESKGPDTGFDEEALIDLFEKKSQHQQSSAYFSDMSPLDFEKDDDSNGHIDFIVATSNLRAQMYGIEQSDRFNIKRVAGKIIPAIATTTATVAGLVILELFKVLRRADLESYKNSFLSLALPTIVLSEPGPAKKTTFKGGKSFSLWDRICIQGNDSMTMEEFIQACQKELPYETEMVLQGSKMIYAAFMVNHKNLREKMSTILRREGDKAYVDLMVAFADMDDSLAMNTPPFRYFF